MTWKGSIYVSGPENFSNLVSTQKDAMWKSLSIQSSKGSKPSPISPCRDKDMKKLMMEDCTTYQCKPSGRWCHGQLANQLVYNFRTLSLVLQCLLTGCPKSSATVFNKLHLYKPMVFAVT